MDTGEMEREKQRERPEHRLERHSGVGLRTDKMNTEETEERKHGEESEGDKAGHERTERENNGCRGNKERHLELKKQLKDAKCCVLRLYLGHLKENNDHLCLHHNTLF